MKELNIIIVRHVQNSPDTNVLDPGIWMSLQSAVKKYHRFHRGDKEALNATEVNVWDDVTNEQASKAIFDWLIKNYVIICQNSSDNYLVEAFSRKSRQGCA